MADFLNFPLLRTVIIVIAVCGAFISSLGSYLMRQNSTVSPARAKLILRSGYLISWISVVTFIVTGFLIE